jgi:hypothetical protein
MYSWAHSTSVGSNIFEKRKCMICIGKWRGPIYPCKSPANIENKNKRGSEKNGKEPFPTFCHRGTEP